MVGGMHGKGDVWWGACMAGGTCLVGEGMCGRGACLTGGACMAGVAWQGGMVDGGMLGRGSAWQGVCVACMPPSGRYYEIRSMSGRYASCWNEFLLLIILFEISIWTNALKYAWGS